MARRRSSTWYPRPARSLAEELAVAARNEHRIILTIPTAELYGESGEVIGKQSGLLRVAFSSDQAKRMLRRIQATA